MGFLYYLPGERTYNANMISEPLRKERLHLILRNASITQKSSAGPDGKSGCIFAPTNQHFPPTEIGYDKEHQEWRECRTDGKTSYWLGVDRRNPPSPKTLARETFVLGERVKIGDHEWMVPICGPSGIHLPSGFTVDIDGEWSVETDESYHDLMKLSEQVVNYLAGDWEDSTRVMKSQLQFACDLLAVNYRVSNRQVGWMKLLKTANLLSILEAGLGEKLVVREANKEIAVTDVSREGEGSAGKSVAVAEPNG
jgi:hypothetical protein